MLEGAAEFVELGGTIKIKGNSSVTSSPEVLFLDTHMKIEAISGTVRIGTSPPP